MSAPAGALRRASPWPYLWLCFVWLVSAAPFLVPEARLAGVSRTALVALPWIAYAGLPRAHPGESALRDVAFELSLMIPPLALGAWIDLASGLPRAEILLVALASATCVAALSIAARLSATSPSTLRGHAIAWIVFVAGIPLLHSALLLGGAPLFTPPGWMTWLADASPIAFVIAHLDAAHPPAASPWPPLLLVLALLSIGFFGARTARGGETAA